MRQTSFISLGAFKPQDIGVELPGGFQIFRGKSAKAYWFALIALGYATFELGHVSSGPMFRWRSERYFSRVPHVLRIYPHVFRTALHVHRVNSNVFPQWYTLCLNPNTPNSIP